MSNDDDQPAISRTAVIKQLIDKDSGQAQTQTKSNETGVNTCIIRIDSETQTQRLPEMAGECRRVRAVNENTRKANSALQALIDYLILNLWNP